MEKKGEKLTTEQKHACKKYEEVIHSLDLAKELNKQFGQVAKEANREAKRESKRVCISHVSTESKSYLNIFFFSFSIERLSAHPARIG